MSTAQTAANSNAETSTAETTAAAAAQASTVTTAAEHQETLQGKAAAFKKGEINANEFVIHITDVLGKAFNAGAGEVHEETHKLAEWISSLWHE